MKKKKFVESWEGPRVGPNRLRWAHSEGSSLNDGEKKTLGRGGVVFHKKSAPHVKASPVTKVFVIADGELYAVSVEEIYIPLLKLELAGVGYSIDSNT